jgi:hypothetical protein
MSESIVRQSRKHQEELFLQPQLLYSSSGDANTSLKFL